MPERRSELVGRWLQNVQETLRSSSASSRRTRVYVSLNTEDAEFTKILPWAGTSDGPQALLDSLEAIISRWESQAFNVSAMFGDGEDVAVFGDFRYKSNSLGNIVTSPFPTRVRVEDGKVTYAQFLEDTYAIAESFRNEGAWTVQTETDTAPFVRRLRPTLLCLWVSSVGCGQHVHELRP
jgi:ketosteroid isomerase-like protein